jgi:hypothetical protein
VPSVSSVREFPKPLLQPSIDPFKNKAHADPPTRPIADTFPLRALRARILQAPIAAR